MVSAVDLLSERQLVHTFGVGEVSTNGLSAILLGGKGANLAEMATLGLPVPPGFTIVTDACSIFYTEGKNIPSSLTSEIEWGIAAIEKATGRLFGEPANASG